MSEFKGTQGKWEVIDNYDNDRKIYVGTDNGEGDEVYSVETSEMTYMEDLANAKIIAHAKELLEALQNLSKAISDGNIHLLSEWNLKSKELIKSATEL